MDKMLLVVGRGLLDKGYIDKDLLVWGRRTKKSSPTHEFVIIGLKEEKLMLLPFKENFDNILYDQVKYYEKGSVILKYSRFSANLTISFPGRSDFIEYSDKTGGSELNIIVLMFNKAYENELKGENPLRTEEKKKRRFF